MTDVTRNRILLLLASHFTEGWNCPPRAFVVVGSLVSAIAFTYELITRNRNEYAYRAAVGIAFVAGFILMLGELRPNGRWQPFRRDASSGADYRDNRRRLRASATEWYALAQFLVLTSALITLITRYPDVTSWTLPQLLGFGGNALFAMLFIGSAVLFRKAADRESASAAI